MKWIGQHIYDLISRFRNDVYLEDLTTDASTDILVVDSNNKICKNAGAGDDTVFTVSADGGSDFTIVDGDTLGIVSATGITTTASISPDTVTIQQSSVSRTNNTSAVSPAHGATFTTIDSVATSLTGHVSAVNTKTVTLPSDTDTTYSAGTLLDLSGTTFNVDLNEAPAAVMAAGDGIIFVDADDSNIAKQETLQDLLDTIAGTVGTTGLDRSGATLVVSDLHSVGVDGSNNQLLTDVGDGTINSEAALTFDTAVGSLKTVQTLTTATTFPIAMEIDANYSGNAAQNAKGLYVDFDRTVPGLLTTAHSDTGIYVNANSASLGTSFVRGIDIDVTGATSGTSTAYGIDVKVAGASTNYAIKALSSHSQLQLLYDGANYFNVNVSSIGLTTLQTIGSGTTTADLLLAPDGAVILRPVDVGATVGLWLDGNDAADNIVQIDAGVLDINATGAITIDGDTIDIRGTDEMNLAITSSTGGEDLTIQQIGANDSSIIITAAGTGTDAIKIDATAGDMLIAPTLINGKTLKIGPTSATEMVFTPHGTAANEKISLTNTSGTADDAIKIDAVAGGLTLAAGNDSLHIDADGTDADALNIDSAGGLDIDIAAATTLDTKETLITSTVTTAEGNHDFLKLDANTSADAVQDATALYIDFDRTTPSGGTAAHNDIGINLDVLSFSLGGGDSTAIGLDIDVIAPKVGSNKNWGINSSTTGGGFNYGAKFLSSHTQLQLLYDASNYCTFVVNSAGATTIQTLGSGTTDSDITLNADGKIVMSPADIAGDVFHLDADASATNTVNIDAGILDIDVTGRAELDAGVIELTTTATSGHISLISAHTAGDAFHLDADADVDSTVNIDAGILDIDVRGRSDLDTLALTITNPTADSATQGGILKLVGDDGALMQSGSRLGVIEFKGAEAGSGATTVGARIEAITESTWSTTVNDASLKFYTTTGDATERCPLTLDSNQRSTFTQTQPSSQAATPKNVVIDANYSGTTDQTATGLHVDFYRALPGSGAGAHTDIGIDLDVIGLTRGDGTCVGMDVDVSAASIGGNTVRGIDVKVIGSTGGDNIGIKSEITDDGATHWRMQHNSADYANFTMANTGALGITTVTNTAGGADITLTANGDIKLLSANATDARTHGVTGLTGIPLGLQQFHFRGYCLGLENHNWQYPEDFADQQAQMGGGQLNTDYGNSDINSGTLPDTSSWFRHGTYTVGRHATSIKMRGWCTSAGAVDAGNSATDGNGKMNKLSIAIVALTPEHDGSASLALSQAAGTLRVITTATFDGGSSNDKTMRFSHDNRVNILQDDILMPMMIAGWDESAEAGQESKAAYFNMMLEVEWRDV